MTDLLSFLRSALDEHEAWAHAASKAYPYAEDRTLPPAGVRWRWVTGDDWDTVTPDPAVEEFLADGYPVWLATVETWPSGDRRMPNTYTEPVQEMDAAAAGHIQRNDPAHVLRTVAAHREILDEALSWRHVYIEDCWYSCGLAVDPSYPDEGPGSGCCNDDTPLECTCGVDDRRERVLRSLAAIYRESHPGFDPSWMGES
jgi:hypothetical protein